MQRRTLLRLGLGGATILALAGGATALFKPGVAPNGQLTPSGREVFRAVGRAVLAAVLPTDEPTSRAALDAHLSRLDTTVAGFPVPVRDELSLLLSLLGAAPGRIALAGLSTPWAEAAVPELQEALQSMRLSSASLRQQAYHALRDLTNAAYFADPGTWPLLGYPGPREV